MHFMARSNLPVRRLHGTPRPVLRRNVAGAHRMSGRWRGSALPRERRRVGGPGELPDTLWRAAHLDDDRAEHQTRTHHAPRAGVRSRVAERIESHSAAQILESLHQRTLGITRENEVEYTPARVRKGARPLEGAEGIRSCPWAQTGSGVAEAVQSRWKSDIAIATFSNAEPPPVRQHWLFRLHADPRLDTHEMRCRARDERDDHLERRAVRRSVACVVFVGRRACNAGALSPGQTGLHGRGAWGDEAERGV